MKRGPWFWIKVWPSVRLGVRPDGGEPPLFSERYGYTRVWRFLGYKASFRSGPLERAASFFLGGWS